MNKDRINSYINEWNQVEQKLQEYTVIMKKLKDKKEQLETNILHDMRNNNINEIKMNRNKYYLASENSYTNLSYKFIKEKLKQLFKDENKAQKIILFLKGERDKKTDIILKKKNI